MNKLVIGGVIAIVLIIIGVVAYMNMQPQQPGGTTQGGSTPNPVTLNGAGSTFVYPQVKAWTDQIKQKYPWLTINYNSVGSGEGVSNFQQKLVDFGGSDPPLPYNTWKSMNGTVIQMPVIIGALAVMYNIPGVKTSLNLTGEILAKIYKGEIVYWDDPLIKKYNPNVNLPHEQIIAVHRSDGSGTTEVFTTFLYKSAPNVWSKDLVGKSINWPVDNTGRGVGQKGSEGVTTYVKNTPYTIGYAELNYALSAGLPIASIQNPLGQFVYPTAEAIQKTIAGIKLPKSPLDDFNPVTDQLIYANVSGGYPISTFTYLLFYTKYPADKVEAIKTFIKYINTEGQNPNNVLPGYIPLPQNVIQLNLKALDLITAG